MAQHDFSIANQGFPAFRSDLNDALESLVTNSSGSTEPSTTYAHQFWVDTAANPSVLKQRNADNDAWVTIANIDQAGDKFILVNPEYTGTLTGGAGVVNLGSGQVYKDASGNVGIGTSSPSEKLVVSRLGGEPSNIPTLSSNITAVLHSGDGSTGSGSGLSLLGGNASDGLISFDDTDAAQKGRIVYRHASDSMAFETDGSEAMRITSDGNVGIGASSPNVKLHVSGTGTPVFRIQDADGADYYAQISQATGSTIFDTRFGASNGAFIFRGLGGGSADEYMRIDSSGNLLVGKTSANTSVNGFEARSSGFTALTVEGEPFHVERTGSDGILVRFRQDGATEGNISVSGTTVSYNGGHLSRWAQTTTAKDASLVKGTVLSNLDEMNVYVAPTIYWTEEDELPEGVNVGDIKVETHSVDNEQLNKVKVSDVEGDANVAGVFVNWDYDQEHNVDEINMAMTGDMIIRIAAGTTVARGDLLMSAGDGTAKPQGDDIVRAKTIAKVTSTHTTCTYEDGSFCVPCVLMAC